MSAGSEHERSSDDSDESMNSAQNPIENAIFTEFMNRTNGSETNYESILRSAMEHFISVNDEFAARENPVPNRDDNDNQVGRQAPHRNVEAPQAPLAQSDNSDKKAPILQRLCTSLGPEPYYPESCASQSPPLPTPAINPRFGAIGDGRSAATRRNSEDFSDIVLEHAMNIALADQVFSMTNNKKGNEELLEMKCDENIFQWFNNISAVRSPGVEHSENQDVWATLPQIRRRSGKELVPNYPLQLKEPASPTSESISDIVLEHVTKVALAHKMFPDGTENEDVLKMKCDEAILRWFSNTSPVRSTGNTENFETRSQNRRRPGKERVPNYPLQLKKPAASNFRVEKPTVVLPGAQRSCDRKGRNLCCCFCHGTAVAQAQEFHLPIPSKDAEGPWSNHRSKENGLVACPVLRLQVCRLCGATGDHAHTTNHHMRYISPFPLSDTKLDL